MNDRLWRNVLLVLLFAYGPFLILESLLDLWPTEQLHSIVQFIGGVSMILWGIRYFIERTSMVAHMINGLVISALAGLCVLMPTLVVIASIP